MTKRIPLTQGKYALVDDEDFHFLSQWKWYAHRIPKKTKEDTWYAERRQWIKEQKKYKIIAMHRLLMNFPKGKDIDHINGNGLDNRRSNLRILSRRQNQQNKRAPKSSKYPGVCWDKYTQKWVAHVSINGEYKKLGRYDSEKGAFEAYKKAVKNYLHEDVIPEFQ